MGIFEMGWEKPSPIQVCQIPRPMYSLRMKDYVLNVAWSVDYVCFGLLQ